MPNNRDDFSGKTKSQLAKRAGWLCSDPLCRRPTTGSNSDGDGEINLSIAAHICAAAPEGPRYDINMTPAQRKSPDNGIWMCSLHGKAVDARDSKYTVELLRKWKAQAQRDSMQRVLYGNPTHGLPDRTYTPSELAARLRDAAVADLDVFRRSVRWPSAAIELTLKVEALQSADDEVSNHSIARRFGFSNPSRFIASYSKQFGEHPNATRRRATGWSSSLAGWTAANQAVLHLASKAIAYIFQAHCPRYGSAPPTHHGINQIGFWSARIAVAIEQTAQPVRNPITTDPST